MKSYFFLIWIVLSLENQMSDYDQVLEIYVHFKKIVLGFEFHLNSMCDKGQSVTRGIQFQFNSPVRAVRKLQSKESVLRLSDYHKQEV